MASSPASEATPRGEGPAASRKTKQNGGDRMTYVKQKIKELESEIAGYQKQIRYFEERAADLRDHIDHVIAPQIEELKKQSPGQVIQR